MHLFLRTRKVPICNALSSVPSGYPAGLKDFMILDPT
jgi:hypothetical protein